MTISTTSNIAVAQGNGLTTSFSFSFLIPLASELFVYLTNAGAKPVPLSQTQYSVAGIGNANGGTVTYPLAGSPIPSGSTITIQRIVPYQQLTDLVNQSGYYPNVVETALDYLTMQTQQLAEVQSRALILPVESSGVSLTIPDPAPGLGLGWDAAGDALINIDFVAEAEAIAAAAAVSASAAAASAVTSQGGATTALAAAAALNASAAALAAGIVTFNQFDMGFVADVPATTTIDLGTVP